MLHYYNLNRQLYVNLDANKEFGFEAHVYYIKNDNFLLRKINDDLSSRKPSAADALKQKFL